MINGAKCGRIFMRDSSFSRGVTSGLAYYQNRPDGLFSMGYGEGYHGGPFSFFNIEDDPLFLRFRRLRTFTSNSKTKAIPKNPIQLLKFPVNINEEWVSYEYAPPKFVRKWLGRVRVSTKAGNFDCVKLHLYPDLDSDGVPDSNFATIYQYFSSEGLIKEEHFQDGITFAEGGPARLEVVKELISFKK